MSLFSSLKFVLEHPLNRSRKAAALLRYARWQLGSRVLPGTIAVPFVNDLSLVVEPGMTGATGNIYCGLHEYEDMALALHSLRPGDLFVDIGANIGSYSLLAAAAGAQALAFEPIPTTFLALIRNIRFNGLENQIDARNMGLGAEASTLEFTAGLDTVNHVVSQEDRGAYSINVPVDTLDNCLGNSKAAVIKIDVEGFETSVLQGASKKTLESDELLALIVELNGSGSRYGFDEQALHDGLLSRGFDTFIYEPAARELKSLSGQRSAGGNTVYVRDRERLTERLKSAPRYRLGTGVSI